jgi:hypothetical protein
MSCKKAQGFLETNDLHITGEGDAGNKRKNAPEALKLAFAANKILVAKGKKIVRFDMKKDPPAKETLLAHILGPTGNLRAPALRRGETLLVGFNSDLYQEVLGQS